MLRRQCTQDYKLRPIQKKVREMLGLQRGRRGPKTPIVEQWIGISTDEAMRVKPSRYSYQKHRWPLIEARMSRSDCLRWCERNGYPTPPKSACTFCPYQSNARWRTLRDGDPAAFAQAVKIDEAIRPGMAGPKHPQNEQWFLHADRVPLANVDLSTAEDRGQLNLFINECEGMCGV